MSHATSLRVRTGLALAGALGLFAIAAPVQHVPVSFADRPAASLDPALTTVSHGMAKVIVQGTPTAGGALERSIRGLGGTVTRNLPIIDGFAATVPASSLDAIARLPGVRNVSLDRQAHVQQDATTTAPAPPSVYGQVVAADAMAAAGYTGNGVGVALIDTGISSVPDVAGRILPIYNDKTHLYSPCVNLSGETDCTDSYGHGTFLAGIIAGNGTSSGGLWKGVAPEANLVPIKIAGADGSADVSAILAGIQWAVSFKDRYNIKVLNLSLGTDSTQSYKIDPLNYAVERAWASGIVVVASASNRGPDYGTIAKPGDDPWVITVGATDDLGTVGLLDDEVPDFSSRGPSADGFAKPDVTAPGTHIVSLRAPGSAIDTMYPNYVDGSYRRGSGTSMSTAVVSGGVALMVEADPTLVPDRVKYELTATARPAASSDPLEVGTGIVDLYDSVFNAPPGLANQYSFARSTGLGKIDASRHTVDVQVSNTKSSVIVGEITAQVQTWNAANWTGSQWTGAKWYGTKWYGARWYGARWYGARWYGAKWYGARWYGIPDGARWYGNEWSGAKWYGAWE